jgi:hypothetical protein
MRCDAGRPCRQARGKEVIRVPVKVVAGAVVAHGWARVGLPGGNPHVARIDPGVEHLPL